MTRSLETAALTASTRARQTSCRRNSGFPATGVKVTKIGDKVILEPVEAKPFDAEAFWGAIDGLGDKPFLPEGREGMQSTSVTVNPPVNPEEAGQRATPATGEFPP